MNSLLKDRARFLRKAIPFSINYVRRYFAEGRFTPRARPRLSLETTNVCNAKCVFCANPVMQRRKEALDIESFKKAVDQFAAMGGTVIDFNVTIGDPLLDPLLLERSRYVRRYPQFTSLGFVTTLQWLHRYDLDEFFRSGIDWLSISTTLSGRESYRKFFGVDKYNQMLNNLVTLLQENRKRGHPIAVMIHIKPTEESAEEVAGHPDFRMVQALQDADLVAEINNRGYYVDDWIGAVKLPPYLKKRPLYPRAFRPCHMLYGNMIVYSNGKIGACNCRDFETSSELILGHIKENSLEELWKSERLSKLRSNWRWKNQVPDICKSCRHYIY